MRSSIDLTFRGRSVLSSSTPWILSPRLQKILQIPYGLYTIRHHIVVSTFYLLSGRNLPKPTLTCTLICSHLSRSTVGPNVIKNFRHYLTMLKKPQTSHIMVHSPMMLSGMLCPVPTSLLTQVPGVRPAV